MSSTVDGRTIVLTGASSGIGAEGARKDGISATTVYFPMVRTQMSGRTDIYRAMPMLSADRAANWLVKAVVDRPTRVTSLQGAAAEIGMAAMPGVLTAGLRPVFRQMDRALARWARGDIR